MRSRLERFNKSHKRPAGICYTRYTVYIRAPDNISDETERYPEESRLILWFLNRDTHRGRVFACCDSEHYRAPITSDIVGNRCAHVVGSWEPHLPRWKGGRSERVERAGREVGGALSRRGWKSLSAGIRHSCVSVAWVPAAAHSTCARYACVHAPVHGNVNSPRRPPTL